MEDNKLIKKALKDWIDNENYDIDATYVVAGSESYSLRRIREEIENETEFGIKLAEDMIQLTIDLLVRGKKQL